MKIKDFIERWQKENGRPDLVVASRALRFQIDDILWFLYGEIEGKVMFLALPSQVWEQNKVYMQNTSMTSVVFFTKDDEVLENAPKVYSWSSLPTEVQAVLADLKKELAGIGWDIKDMSFQKIPKKESIST